MCYDFRRLELLLQSSQISYWFQLFVFVVILVCITRKSMKHILTWIQNHQRYNYFYILFLQCVCTLQGQLWLFFFVILSLPLLPVHNIIAALSCLLCDLYGMLLQGDDINIWKLLECRITGKSQRNKETLIIHIPVNTFCDFCACFSFDLVYLVPHYYFHIS